MEQKKMSTRETVAVVISSVMVIVAIAYWINQIDGVLEMFKLAAGG